MFDARIGPRRLERVYQAIVACCADAIALVDREGAIQFVTDSIERLTGLTSASLIGTHALDHVHPDDRQRADDAFHEVLARPGVPIPFEYRVRHADGSWRHCDVIAVNQSDDPEVDAIILTYRDTTARWHAEAALLESERLHRSTFDQAPIGVAHTSLTGRFLRVNRCLCALLGYTAEELTSLDFKAITHPDDVQQDLEAMRRLIEGEVNRYTREKRYRRKDGSFVLVNLMVNVHRNPLGDAVFFVAVLEDLTERKRLEQGLRNAAKMEAIGRLAGGIAHDFNNLLTAIGGYAELAIDQLHSPRLAVVRKDVEEVRAACRIAASLTRQLLAFSRRQILQPQIVDLNLVLHRMQRLLPRLIGEHIEIVWRLSSPLDRVNVDAGQIEQVVLNLVLNGRDAMPHGGTLTIETANRLVENVPHVKLAIRDTGVGIGNGAREHLFEPFFTTKDVGYGTGLGLATVYGIVNQSGGGITVDSEQGRGTTFTVLLPSVSRVGEAADAPAAPAAIPGGTETILLLEDQAEVRSVVKQTLERHGYTVIAAANAGEALGAMQRGAAVHLLLADVVLPGMSGPEVARELRATSPEVPVLFMSGYAVGAGELEGPLERPSPLLEKPFSAEVLLRKVREQLDRPADGVD